MEDKMDIGLIGGTGDIGKGFAIRWGKNHRINVGSREEERAKRAAKRYREKLEKKDFSYCDIEGYKNSEAIRESDVVILSLPFEVITDTLDSLKKHFSDQIVISPVVPMYKSEGVFECRPKCAAKVIRNYLPNSIDLVSAFHSVPAGKLADLNKSLNCDVVVCGDNENAKEVVFELIQDINGLRPLEGGSLEVSTLCESLTPLLLNIAIRNDIEDPSIKFMDNK
ncbi:NADPH-dependent F420 reductase [archaeon SCG-AAA382B04]|nr:NADPH-dependent F420 reductase [archaeon SCG-AAA382B04]